MADLHEDSERRSTVLNSFAVLLAITSLALTGYVYIFDSGWSSLPGFSTRGNTPFASTKERSSQEQGRPLGFDLSQLSIPRAEIYGGGPTKGSIPSLSHPEFVSASEVQFVENNDRVIGVVRGDDARAYPLKILNFHEIVNDNFGDEAIAATYCPLCDSAIVFDRKIDGRIREFGVSGLLFNSNVLMYDRSGDESLWSQLMASGVSGPANRRSLKTVPFELTTWGDWRARYADTRILSFETGHVRRYDRDSYKFYRSEPFNPLFPVSRQSDVLPANTPVLGIWTDQSACAYPIYTFHEGLTKLDVEIGSKRATLSYNATAKSLRVTQADHDLNWAYSYWFAWYAFHPETKVHRKHPCEE